MHFPIHQATQVKLDHHNNIMQMLHAFHAKAKAKTPTVTTICHHIKIQNLLLRRKPIVHVFSGRWNRTTRGEHGLMMIFEAFIYSKKTTKQDSLGIEYR